MGGQRYTHPDDVLLNASGEVWRHPHNLEDLTPAESKARHARMMARIDARIRLLVARIHNRPVAPR
jgi:hypothetical protein